MDGMILVRDSKNPQDPPQRYTRAEMDAFLDGAKKGEFDELVRGLTVKKERARSPSFALHLGELRSIGASILALIAMPATAVGWMTALLSAVATLIVSLSLLTGAEVLHTRGGAAVTLVALLVLAVSRRLTRFKSRHLHG
jgi:hypothetical protein